jgi:hypothetical protein
MRVLVSGHGDSAAADAYRKALRATLAELPTPVKAGYEDWFKNWDLCT